MPSPGRISNTTTSFSPSSTGVRGAMPHVAQGPGGTRGLTPNEREARRQHRMVRTANSFPVDRIGGGNTAQAGAQQSFSPQMSTDFLELPQSIREKREIYRHFYNTDPIVGQAIDVHTELPLSKVRLAAPKPTTAPEGFKSPEAYGKFILSKFEKMCKRTKLFQRLIMAVRHLWLDGTVAIFAEDSEVQIPSEIGYDQQIATNSVLDEDGNAIEQQENAWIERPDREAQELAYYQKHYRGWDRLLIIPIDQVQITSWSFSDKCRVELIPSDRDRAVIEQARMGDPEAEEMANEIPEEVRAHIEEGRLIPLGTDPDEGSFVYLLMSRNLSGEEIGQSILDRCLRTLYYKEKLRQAQTQIASRAMTPKRVVWAEDISEADVEDLREQVDLSLVDPDYSIVANYEIHWEEMGSKDRLLDLSAEYEITDKQLYSGLGITEALLSGESLYSGDRLKLEIMNTRYLFLREILQEYVEDNLFMPVARRMGFVEKDEWGDEVVLYPRLSFTRLPLRDSQDTFDAMFNLYTKGSLPIDTILELLNLDANDIKAKLEKDMFTVNDAVFNEVTRGIYTNVAEKIVGSTNVAEKIAKYLKLEFTPQPTEGRF